MPKPLSALQIRSGRALVGKLLLFRARARTILERLKSEATDMNRALLKMVRNKARQPLRFSASRAMATALVAVFAGCLAATSALASPLPQDDQAQPPTVRERVMAMPPHTLVQVRVHNKSLRGRVRIANRKGFVLQFTADGKDRNQKISYDDVQSLDTVDENGKGGKVSLHLVI